MKLNYIPLKKCPLLELNMASACVAEEEVYREVLTCPICLCLLTNPKVTSCMHTVCCGCLDKWINQKAKQVQKVCPCPVCRVDFKVPKGGANALKGNYILNDMLDALRKKLEKMADNIEQYCDICVLHDNKVQATSKCIDCDQFICDSCTRTHQSIRAVKGHKVIPITGDDQKDTRATLEMFPKRSKFCESHPDEPLKFYCTSCCEVLCRDCCITTHSGHKCEDLTHNVKGDMKNIGSLIEMAVQREANVKNAIEEMNEYKEIMENNAVAVKAAINATRKAQHDLIDKHYNNQVTEVEKLKHDTMKKVDVHIDSLELQNGITLSTKHLLEMQQQFGHPAQIISIRQELNSKTKEWSQPLELEFEPRIKIIFNDGKTTESGLNFGSVMPLEKTLNKFVRIEKNPFAMVGTMCSFELLENGDIVSAHLEGGINITDHITHEQKHHVKMRCIRLTTQGNNTIAVDRDTGTIKQLDEKGNFEREVDCIKPSDHCVAAGLDGKLIATHGKGQVSHIDVNTNTLISTHKIKDDGNVPNISITSRSETVISYFELNIVEKYSKNGDLLFTYNGQQGEYGLKTPTGVCVDPFDRIIVASSDNNTVHLLDSKGKFIKLLVTPKDNIIDPQDVAMDKQNRLIVGTYQGKLHYVNYMAN
ncbi:unnamed protein product [Owenia fusiformis]|uniref:Uncharacterized protein n=1 Tax=Owenia fusiformis TaxID=6347 RepID=A0A8S4NBI2_OWEFU|nr:unnamed protein product [Owenia fusiformis]